MERHYKGIADTLPHSMERPKPHDNSPTLEEAVTHINSMDFSLIREKLTLGDPLLCRQWSEVEIEVGLQYYKKFFIPKQKVHRKISSASSITRNR